MTTRLAANWQAHRLLTLHEIYATHAKALVATALLALVAGCEPAAKSRVQGYVEGEFVYAASPIAGALETLPVQRGAQVGAGDPLFALECGAARLLFHVPMHGSIPLLLVVALVFIAANLAMGITFSTVAKNQLQAMPMTFFVFLPSIFLSGFMFPFCGMPRWAQTVGEVLPLTHFLRIVRAILLKGNGLAEVTRELWPITLFAAVMLTIGIKRYRQTLD